MSDNRTAAINCPHGEACGACALLGVGYPAQLGRKRRILGEALKRYRTLAKADLLSCLGSPLAEKYRNRTKMAVGLSKGKQAKLGYFRSRTREITDAPDCRVLIPGILETSRALRGLLRRWRDCAVSRPCLAECRYGTATAAWRGPRGPAAGAPVEREFAEIPSDIARSGSRCIA